MKQENFTWKIFATFVFIAVLIFVISFAIDLNYEGNIKFIEIILSSSSISIGFFGTIFTFIFGLKDNNIFRIIMKNENSKLQFKTLNVSLIFLGFGIIILCIIMIALLYNQNFDSYSFINVMVKLIFSLLVLYYLFFSTYLFIITKLVFKDENKEIVTVESPKIKKGVAEAKIEERKR
ncbi:hypothetical protein AABD40_12520 [Staphylococcus shinii]|jgi:hypothetical protein|uniref:hypothetical protein n=1 Tax=Staphylococcus shinii TaxID=2912228 RepID=UPI00298ED9AC|nr:hypothetical protein [Staphylococcus shinii]MDW8570543.1 hypothetical protein [Staphylococcus shinii]MDW8573553.1 hypothetical protein [Staphylococcus shinii]